MYTVNRGRESEGGIEGGELERSQTVRTTWTSLGAKYDPQDDAAVPSAVLQLY